MGLFYGLLCIVILWGVKFKLHGFHEDYLDKGRTTAINGVFIALVFLSHSLQYLDRWGYAFDGIGDGIALSLRSGHRQLIVVMFLFYSGFGVMESFKKKGQSYIDSMPKHRLLTTWLNYFVSVVVGAVVGYVCLNTWNLREFLIKASSYSSWYIFAILFCYGLFYVVGKVVGQKLKWLTAVVCLGTIVYAVCLMFISPCYYYNTIIAFAFGVAYSEYRKEIETIIKRHYWLALAVSGVIFAIIFAKYRLCEGVGYNLIAALFAFIVVMLTMKVKMYNPVLSWIGSRLFPIYLYHSIVFKVFGHYLGAPTQMTVIIFVLLSIALTGAIAALFKYFKISPK